MMKFVRCVVAWLIVLSVGEWLLGKFGIEYSIQNVLLGVFGLWVSVAAMDWRSVWKGGTTRNDTRNVTEVMNVRVGASLCGKYAPAGGFRVEVTPAELTADFIDWVKKVLMVRFPAGQRRVVVVEIRDMQESR